ncbi:MAG: DUF1311 domain-containing protein [Deltaproteobacteria bacterium]|nr:MAG: DUF1311 domain-containing protein [Deltaproteobacteria bacterium]
MMLPHLIAAATAALAATSARAGPSFDCANGATPTERLICRDAGLSALDVEVAAAFQVALGRIPAERGALVASQRAWLSGRDNTCRTGVDCLAGAYRDRIAALEADPTNAAAPLCRAIAERYEAWSKRVGTQGGARGARGPLGLKDVTDSGVKVSEPVAVLTDGSKLVEWAREHHPPFALSQELVASFSRLSRVEVEKLPGAEYYAASTIEGTAHCFNSVYFMVGSGQARTVRGPTNWSDSDGKGCGVGRAFGTVDGVPVAFEEADGSTMLEGSLTVSSWGSGRFGPACSLIVRHAPLFSLTEMTNRWEQACDGSHCRALRSAALALVAEVQADPRDALRRALSKISPEQRSVFENGNGQQPNSMGKRAGSDVVLAPDQLTDEKPLVLPMLVESTLYRVTIGHVTIGWRYFPDWRVTFESVSSGAAPASLAIGMSRGELLGVTVH